MHLVGQNEGCGGDLTSSSGGIASIDEDSNGMYDNSLDCLWTVRLSTGQVIIFKFREMDINTMSPRCEQDYLEVRPDIRTRSPTCTLRLHASPLSPRYHQDYMFV